MNFPLCVKNITLDLINDDIDLSNGNITKQIGIGMPSVNASKRHTALIPKLIWNVKRPTGQGKRYTTRYAIPHSHGIWLCSGKKRAENQRIVRSTKRSSWRSFISTMNRFTLLKSILSRLKMISGTNNRSHIPVMGITGNIMTNSQKTNRLVEQFENVSSSENFVEGFQDVKELYETESMLFFIGYG